MEIFLQWYYENEKLIESNHEKFIETAFADWDILALPKSNDLKTMIKQHLIGDRLYEYWEIEFYLERILEPQNSIGYGCRLYSEYFEDKNNLFLNSFCDLIVLYCYDKKVLNLPPLNTSSREKVNSNILYPKIISECKTILKRLKNYPENKEDSFWTHSPNIDEMQNDFNNVLNWYRREIKKVDNTI